MQRQIKNHLSNDICMKLVLKAPEKLHVLVIVSNILFFIEKVKFSLFFVACQMNFIFFSGKEKQLLVRI